ncbi:trigger factor [Pannus brasiliensis CCIBt3594]|uniref:Trigger factor n=1 Tax=Pannus brasiliensis CCIBt3594 TaxID=1427578 RepID=A0AAW9QY41_9CHRO
MKVTQEKLPASQIGLEIEIPAETSRSTYEKVVGKLARTASVPGFRKGKIPRQVLLQRLGTKAVKAAVLEELIEDGLKSALKQESIESLGQPKLLSKFEDLVESYAPGEAITFSASVEVPPTVTLGDYSDIAVTAEETVYDPESVEQWLSEKQQQIATLVPVEDRGAEMGDVAIVDYAGRDAETGEDIEDVRGTDLRVDLEPGRFIEGMVEGIVGMKPEEVKELPLKFPEDYPKEDIAGKAVIFTITMKELKVKELPELDDDFAGEVSDYETIAELRETLEKRAREQAEKETKDSINGALIDELVKRVRVELPETLIDREVSQLLTQTYMQMQQMGIDVRQLFNSESIPKMRENARPDAIENLTRVLAIQELAKAEGIEADEGSVKEKTDKILEQVSERDIDFDRLRAIVTEEVLTDKTLAWLEEKATVTLVPKGTLKTEEDDEEDGEEVVEVEATAEEE